MQTAEPRRGSATTDVQPEAAEPMPEVEEAFEEIEVDAPRVGIIMGSASDKEVMQPAGAELSERGIRYEVRVLSAHRNPDAVADYARNAHMRGLRVIIAAAGMSAALPGVVAAHTDLPVIGVPIKAKSTVGDGLDALLSTVQMPPGVPVACVAINGARNAAVLAARILGC
jgi:phosphoribosylaminoimidazole carboxylase PurE protein